MNDMNSTNVIPQISSRLVIKNIPEKFPDDQLTELIKKNFENRTKDINILKLEHKYSKNNKLCFLTTDNLDTRKDVLQFFNGFELIDPKGFKQKLSIIDCLNQNKQKNQKDKIENTIEQIDHFTKFKEFLNNNKLIDFKNDESKFCEGIFQGVEELETSSAMSLTKSEKPDADSEKKQKSKEGRHVGEKKPGKTIMTKKTNPTNILAQPAHIEPSASSSGAVIPSITTITSKADVSSKNQFPIVSDIEVITTTVNTSDGYYNKKDNYKSSGYNKKQGNKDNYPKYGSGNYHNQSSYNYNKNDNYNNDNYENYNDNSGSGNYYNNGYDNSYKSYDNSYYNNDGGYNYKKNYKKGGYK